MKPDVTEAQLQEIIREVARMTKERGEKLNRDEVKQVVAELNLPPEMVDEAILRINYRAAVKRSEASNRRLSIGMALLTVAALTIAALWWQHQTAVLAQVTAVQDRVTLTEDNHGNLATINRDATEVFYRVTLNQAPVGDQLALQCNWFNPSGTLVHQNYYETRKITTPVWNTYCRLPLGTESAPGLWKVEMRLKDRLLESAEFEVQ